MSRHWRYFPHIRFRFRLLARHTLQFLGLLLTTNIYSAQSKHSVEEFDTLACVLACTGAWSVRGGGWVLTCTGARSVRGRGGGGGWKTTKARPRCPKPYLLYTIFGGKGKTVICPLGKIPTKIPTVQ